VRTITASGFAGSVLTHAVAIAALGVVATGFALTACIFLVISVLLRWATAGMIAAALGLTATKLWLLPVRDALSFAIFVASFFGRKVFWRDQLFQVEPSGRMSFDGDQAS
jgi:ceramide glucosyltransferase